MMGKTSWEHIIIIGGGIGGAIAHDLSLRGFKVTLLERGELASGTTGRHHGLLHSGARYVLHDLPTARECFLENQILRNIAPEALEQNDGLFIAVSDEDLAHCTDFIDKCREAGIPVEKIKPSRALQLEPNLNPQLKTALRVPDATMDAWRLPMHFFASAKSNGADIRAFSEVTEITTSNNIATGVKVFDYRNHQTYDLQSELIINATGPWSGRLAAMLGIEIPVRPVPGVMVSVAPRLTHMVINRLHPADDGDIIVPQRQLSLLGTTAWLGEDPDDIRIPQDHVDKIVKLCAEMVPEVARVPVQAAWMASRPVIVKDHSADPAKISRTFDCIDHAAENGIEGFISILGGKATTMRAMAEAAADLVCAKTGRSVACRTRDTQLRHYRQFFS
ncbi:MAG: FAD-dependent oxidoreductase [Desulfobacterales bacterium]|nr:FAD-dependent oxidoreductase [Desulfobacterales bacterium]